jgi:hypothetical protein
MAAAHLALSVDGAPGAAGEGWALAVGIDLCQVSGKALLQVRSVCQTVTKCQESSC